MELGSSGVMLNVITPLQKFTKGGITLVDVLWQRYYDLYQAEMTPKLLVITEDVFTGKREVSSMVEIVQPFLCLLLYTILLSYCFIN